MAELAADVRRFLHDEAVSVLPDRRWLRLWRRLKRHPWAVLGTVVACLLLSSVLGLLELARQLEQHEQSALTQTAAWGTP